MQGVRRGKARKDGPQLMHGFRYFHETTMGIKGVDKHVMEWLQGRELKTLAERYEDWPPEEILREYWKAVGALTIDQTRYLKLTIDEKDKQIRELKMDEQHRKEFEWGVQSISNQAIQNSVQNQQSIEQLAAVFMAVLTPEQKEMMARQLPQMKDILQPPTVSSLPLEDKKIIVVKKDDSREGSNDGGSNDTTS
jgi:hypothetical protein